MKHSLWGRVAAGALALALLSPMLAGPAHAQGGPHQEEFRWRVQPRDDLEILYSLADYPDAAPEYYRGEKALSFYRKNGQVGAINDEGEIIVPEEYNVHWCSLCGVEDEQVSLAFDLWGNARPTGGHGLDNYWKLYNLTDGELYTADYELLYVQDWDYQECVRVAEVGRLQELPTMTSDCLIWERRLSDQARIQVPAELTTENQWVLYDFMGDLRLDGQRFDEALGQEDPLTGFTFTVSLEQEGFLGLRQGDRWSFYQAGSHHKNEPQLVGSFLEARPFEQEMAAVRTETGWGYVGPMGQPLTRMDLLGAASPSETGYAWIKVEEGWGVVYLPDLILNDARRAYQDQLFQMRSRHWEEWLRTQ